MNKIGEILISIGTLIILLGASITFCFNTKSGLEHIIYFRFILIGLILIISGSALSFKNIYIKNFSIALGGGAIGLLIMSIINLINPSTNLTLYFYYTLLLIFVTFIAIKVNKK